jgi:predicted alpha-1,6-mannanase (GH76 family)
MRGDRLKVKLQFAILIFSFLTISRPVQAIITVAQAEQAIEAFNKVYWNPSTKLFDKRDGTTNPGVLDFWLTAHAWETIMDAYVLTKKPAYLQQIDDIYDGFVKRNGVDWTQNDYNDDIMWWTIASARAFEITGEKRFLDQAKIHFDWVWKGQRDTLKGGIWWKNNEHTTKNSCVVQPTILTAIYLARALKDDGYRVKAESLYAWQKRTLLNPNNPGQVYDAIRVDGTMGTGSTTYNQGTFIGSATGLGHFADAKICAEWTKKNMCDATGILREKAQGDFAAFKLILVRYVIGYARTPGSGGAAFESWMDANATAVWNKRRIEDDIMGFDWMATAPATGIETASASSGVALLALLATPASTAISPRTPSAGKRLHQKSKLSILAYPEANAPAIQFRIDFRNPNGQKVVIH